MSVRTGSRGSSRRGTPKRSSSRMFIEPFDEPVPRNNGDFSLKTTGQGLGELPNDNALTFLVDPERAQRQSLRPTTPKINRRPPRSVNENSPTDPDLKGYRRKVDGEEKLFLRLKRNLESNSPETYSFIRENPIKGTEDYRHNRLDAKGQRAGSKGKRHRTSESTTHDETNESHSPKRSRRATRPSVDEYEHKLGLSDEEEELQFRTPSPTAVTQQNVSKDTSSPFIRKLEHGKKSSPITTNKRPTPIEKSRQVTPEISVKQDLQPKDLVNNDYCNSCGGTGELLCCETCVRSFHFSCVEPPVMSVDEIPDDVWSCRHCRPRLLKPEEKNLVSKTFFGSLILGLESHNAVAYQVPTHIREMFAHIQTSKFGEYEDEFMKSESMTSGPRIQDKSGNTLLCFKCKSSALNGKDMAVCSKCQTSWHIDCVDPPLESTPYGFWVCPLHSGNSIELPLRVKKPTFMTVALSRQVSNNGDIEVLDNESDSESNSQHLDDEERIDAGSFSDEEVTKNINFPAQTRMLPDGSLISKSSRLRSKGNGSDLIVYKLPSRTIKLDFLDAVHASRTESLKSTPTSDFLAGLDCLATLPQVDSEAVRNLMHLKLQGPAVRTAEAKENLATLLDAALDDENEIGQIMAIRKLMKEKGRQRLLEMLSVS